MAIARPNPSEYIAYYETYISKVPENDLIASLKESGETFAAFIKSIPPEKLDYRYAAGKWTIKEIVSHITDAERVFSYRALRFARNDKTELPGFDENEWTPESNAENRNIEAILKDFRNVRQATISLFEGFTPEMPLRRGIACGKEISVRALGYIIPGHELHHLEVIKSRYL